MTSSHRAPILTHSPPFCTILPPDSATKYPQDVEVRKSDHSRFIEKNGISASIVDYQLSLLAIQYNERQRIFSSTLPSITFVRSQVWTTWFNSDGKTYVAVTENPLSSQHVAVMAEVGGCWGLLLLLNATSLSADPSEADEAKDALENPTTWVVFVADLNKVSKAKVERLARKLVTEWAKKGSKHAAPPRLKLAAKKKIPITYPEVRSRIASERVHSKADETRLPGFARTQGRGHQSPPGLLPHDLPHRPNGVCETASGKLTKGWALSCLAKVFLEP